MAADPLHRRAAALGAFPGHVSCLSAMSTQAQGVLLSRVVEDRGFDAIALEEGSRPRPIKVYNVAVRELRTAVAVSA